MQAQMFREQVAALNAGRQSQDEVVAELAELRKEERTLRKAAKHVGFNAFLKGYKAQDDSKHSQATTSAPEVDARVEAATSSGMTSQPEMSKAPVKGRDNGKQLGRGSKGGGKAGSRERPQAQGDGTSAEQQLYKNAVRDVVKKELLVALKQGTISREQFKDIARRATEKVVSLTAVGAARCC
jgi:hypothetical protein